MQLLSLGRRLSGAPSKLSELNIKVQLKNLISQMNDLVTMSYDSAEHFKSNVLNCCFDCVNKTPRLHNILAQERLKQLNELKSNENLIITRLGKGPGIVRLNKSDYVKKLSLILSEDNKFQKQTI
ncbi:unnamed protein product [Trichobilharzia regenti]|nr:unnamed protein product [Trichobilharzia regenti]